MKMIVICEMLTSLILLVLFGMSKGQGIDVTNQELLDIGNVLWQKEQSVSNVVFHLQGLLQPNESNTDIDVAPARLFAPIPDGILERSTTVQNFLRLLDNYEPNVKKSENFTEEEEEEIKDFLDSVVDTNVMETAWNFLVSKNFSSPNKEEFTNQLRTIWFDPYSKAKRPNCSSGFEHVFLGEMKGKMTTGFHNWIRFYMEETSSNMDYDGYYLFHNMGKASYLKLKFSWSEHPKPISAMFIRTTPEFELAVYTICFYSRPSKTCKMKFNNRSIPIFTTFKTENGINYLLTAYPLL